VSTLFLVMPHKYICNTANCTEKRSPRVCAIFFEIALIKPEFSANISSGFTFAEQKCHSSSSGWVAWAIHLEWVKFEIELQHRTLNSSQEDKDIGGCMDFCQRVQVCLWMKVASELNDSTSHMKWCQHLGYQRLQLV